MSYTKIGVHYVWATKSRKPILTKEIRNLLFDHIKQNAVLKGIHLDRINGYEEHVHCLVWLKPMQTVDKVANLIKGESAYWFNNLSGFKGVKLQWQENYYAISVSLFMMDTVRAYIDKQELHHSKIAYREEEEALMKKYLFKKDLENSIGFYKFNTGR